MVEKEHITDQALDAMLATMKEPAEAEDSVPVPPVVNVFRLQMEAERRRSRRQIQTVTLAAWFSVTATLALLGWIALVWLPEAGKDLMTPQLRLLIAQCRQSAASCRGLFAAVGIAMLLGYIFSAVLLIAKRKLIFEEN